MATPMDDLINTLRAIIQMETSSVGEEEKERQKAEDLINAIIDARIKQFFSADGK